ncbi:YggS family pyridoxal phosphate-dependent enzyme [Haloferula sargassicola]|uniref:Pyridoxal phosphate homeostasis protein n=1 Tax=Haloferula sargassicola TaxID=490096 RepID=A0ABP9UPU5_9BACT
MSPGARLGAVRDRVARACEAAGRDPEEVKLLAVSKTVETSGVRPIYEAGQRAFGESRQQEAEEKIRALPDDIEWHFIGTLQRNKVRKVLEAGFAVIHSIDSLKLARHVDRIAGELGIRPMVFLEVNIADEDSKGGFSPDALRSGRSEILALENLQVAGLMAIPPEEELPERARAWFRRVRELRDELAGDSGSGWSELSMGMSGDFEMAILEGSTLIRVGTAIFGARSDPT